MAIAERTPFNNRRRIRTMNNPVKTKQEQATKAKDWASVIFYIDEQLKDPNRANIDALLDERLVAMKNYATLEKVQLIPSF